MEVTFTLKMTEEQHCAVKDLAQKLDISMAETIRRAIEMLLEIAEDLPEAKAGPQVPNGRARGARVLYKSETV